MRPLILAALVLATAPARAEAPSFTTGPAATVETGLFDCGGRDRVSAVGRITAEDGTEWTVPAATRFRTAPKAVNLYDECTGVTPGGLSDIDLDAVPVMDAGGEEEFTLFLFGDNYFELYANGHLLAVDAVPFTPFNSSVVRFRAERPLTLAVMMVDWEENLGLGSERGRGYSYSPGDGGLVAHLLDAAGDTALLTDESWRAQTFYIAPLADRTCLKLDGPRRDTSACDIARTNDPAGLSAAHWPLPEGWEQPGFDDGAWPMATTFTNGTVGVNNKRGYTNFTDIFDTPGADASFIWSSNLILDNLVLLRRTLP